MGCHRGRPPSPPGRDRRPLADLYGLDPDDFDWIVRDDPTDPKGFYRVDRQLPFRERLTGLAAAAFRALKEGKWSAESAAELSNDEFFDLLGIPELTNAAAAHSRGLPGPLIAKRDGCHVWKPEAFPPEDPRHGWTWDDCWNDAVALLGGEQAVRDYLADSKAVEIEPDSPRRTIEIGTSPDEPPPFQLVSERVRAKTQGRLEVSTAPPAALVPRPKLLDHPDPKVARYLAVVVRIIAAHRQMSPKSILGRKKVEKLVHLIESHLGLDLGRHAVRAAAGPLDMERHKFVCRIAGERGIFLTIEPERHAPEDEEVQTPREEVRFIPAENFDQALAESSDVIRRSRHRRGSVARPPDEARSGVGRGRRHPLRRLVRPHRDRCSDRGRRYLPGVP